MSGLDLELDLEEDDDELRAFEVMRAGIARTPGVRRVFVLGGVLAVAEAIGRLTIPVLVQQVLDRGLLGADGYRPGLVLRAALTAGLIVVVVGVVAAIAEVLLARGAQASLYELRRQAFEHIHRLSLVAHAEERRGTLIARVTTDIEAITRFIEWGAITLARALVLVVGAVTVMMFYSWQLALVVVVGLSIIVPLLRTMQRRQLRAYDVVRTRTGELVGVYNELLVGAAPVRTYGYGAEAKARTEVAILGRYRADLNAARYMSVLFTVGDFIGSATLVIAALAAIRWGDAWGLDVGEVVVFFFLVNLVQGPIGEISEVVDNAQTAVAGWNKVLRLLAVPIDIADPEPGDARPLPHGPLTVELDGVVASYGVRPVLRGVTLTIPAGTSVAVVGETGSGKTTFARLLCRLLDPSVGEVRIGGVPLAAADANDRRRAIRLVPQDGFLFDGTVAENVQMGRAGAVAADVDRAVADLGLTAWVAHLPAGLATPVGPRGESLSVGERQLVALLRAAVSDPGLLILDEATSSVDPETEQALAAALERVAAGRTVVSVAHRLSTAERADLVVVFDHGELVEQGSHTDLVAADGRYARLYRSWQRTVAGGA